MRATALFKKPGVEAGDVEEIPHLEPRWWFEGYILRSGDSRTI
jgi:hypothetical protein